jgi:hypothetical protein
LKGRVVGRTGMLLSFMTYSRSRPEGELSSLLVSAFAFSKKQATTYKILYS